MTRESFDQFKLLNNELEQQIILLRDAYRKIYLKTRNPKYEAFKLISYFEFISYIEDDYIVVSFTRDSHCGYDYIGLERTFTYTFSLREIMMSKEEIERFVESEIYKKSNI